MRLRDAGFDVQRHEDAYSAGIPDLSFAGRGVDGWIELKAVASWPVRFATPVRLDRDRVKIARQVGWLEQRAAHGAARCFILAKVAGEWLLFREGLRRLVDGLPSDELCRLASHHWAERPPCAEVLASALTR